MSVPEMVGSAIAQGLINNVNDAFKQDRQARHYRENAQYDYQLQMQAQQQNYQNAVLSAKNAGLNPAIAAGSSAMSTAASSTPSGSDTSVAPLDPNIGLMRKQADVMKSQMALNNSGIEKNTADANKANEEARRVKQVNDEFEAEKTWFDTGAEGYLAGLRDEADKRGDKGFASTIDFLLDLRGGGEAGFKTSYTPALATALERIASSNADINEAYAKRINADIRSAVGEKQLSDNKVLNALARAPSVQNAKVFSDIAHVNKTIELLGTQKDLTEADIKKVESEITNLGKNSALLDAETKKALGSDFKTYLDNGDYIGAGIELIKPVVQLTNPIMLYFMLKGKKPPTPAAPAAPAAAPAAGMGSALENPAVKVGETKKTLDYQKRVSEPFKQRIEQNKAWGDYRKWYKNEYKKEHNHK